jgi:hypothetical protein
MSNAERHLRLVPPASAERGASPGELEDVGVTLMIFLVAALPLASSIAGLGRWSDGSLGLGTLGVLLAGRELCAWLVARFRSGRAR